MKKKPKARSKKPARKIASSLPDLKTLFRGFLRLFDEELPVTEFTGSAKYDTPVAEVKLYQAQLEAICGGRTSTRIKQPTTAVITPDKKTDIMRVMIDGKIIGQLKPADARFLQKQLAKAEIELCAVKVPALIEGGRRKKNGDDEEFTVCVALPPKPQKKPTPTEVEEIPE